MLMERIVARRGGFASPGLQVLADTLMQGINTARAEVLLCPYDRPLALTYGLRRPTVLLSTWMVEHLDQRELEAVLAHELEHVARHDYLVIWLARVLRDTFFYLPTSRMAYRQLQREKELACDDLAVDVTHRQLALASALAKVWLHAVDDPRHTLFGGAALSIMEVGASIHGRIQRLLASYEPMTSTQRSRIVTLGLSVSALMALGVMQGANLLIIVALMGCNPVVLLQKMF
jgi:beta-lactamase regulating signal transducer with metallopeptidase domain